MDLRPFCTACNAYVKGDVEPHIGGQNCGGGLTNPKDMYVLSGIMIPSLLICPLVGVTSVAIAKNPSIPTLNMKYTKHRSEYFGCDSVMNISHLFLSCPGMIAPAFRR